MDNFQDVLLPLKKPFEIDSEKSATNPLAPENLFSSGILTNTTNSIPSPISPAPAANFLTSQKVEDSKSFAQFLTQPQLLNAVPNVAPPDLASNSILTDSDILTGKKLETPTGSIAFSPIPDASTPERQAQNSITASPIPDTSTPERQAQNSNLPVGVFQVGASGQVSVYYQFDGGYYQGELAIFSLTGMEALVPGTDAFIFEASRRALTNSTLGYVVLRDSTEGAKFSGSMPGEYNWGSGPYNGPQTFTMTPGDTFGVMLIPNGTVQISYNNQWLWDLFPEHRPMFSIVPANSANSKYQMPIADVTGTGNTVAVEDVPPSQADGDYNDLIFTFIGASGNAPAIGSLINPAREWRTTPLGQQIISYANSLVPNDTTPPTIAASLTNDTGTSAGDRITSNPAISGTVTDSSSIASFRAGFDDTPTAEFTDITSFLGSNGSFTLSRAQLETIRRNPLRDGNYTLRLIAADSAGNTSNTFSLDFTLDAATPQTVLQTPISGGNHSNTVRVIGTATDTTTNLSNLQYSVDGGSPNTLTPGTDGKFDSAPPNSPLATGSHTAALTATDTAGNQTSQNLNFSVASNFTVTPNGSTGWAAASTDTVLLAERNSKLVQAVLPVQLGQAKGSRTLRFQLFADFDKTDAASAIEDLFQVFLVSPNNPSQTLLDGGSPGTPLFSLAGSKAEFLPGRVRYTGDIVEIDLTSLASGSGNLLFRLIDSDSDTGSTVEVKNITNTVDEEGTASPVFVAAPNVAAAGGSLTASNLTAAPDLKVNFTQVQFDPATGSYKAAVQVQNTGNPVSRNVAVVFPNLPAGVTLQSPSGTDSSGKPYINLRGAIGAGGLDAGAISDPVEITINNPNFQKFSLTATALAGGANQSPSLAAVQTINVKVGETFKLPLTGTDADGDPISFAVKSSTPLPTGKITGNGTLEISPTPTEIGTYNFTLVASDGELETARPVTVNVTPSTPGRTRISGVIQNTNQQPLAGVLVGLGELRTVTAADGSFEIERLELPSLAAVGLPDIVPPDTLQIYGEGITGEDNYPYIAEKLPLLLEHEVYSNANNFISRPIYLPPIDTANGKIINPAADTTVTTAAIPKASVFVKASSLKDAEGNPYTENLSITEVPTELTPAALPPNLHTDLVVTIQPGDMVFTTPAPLSLPNRAGYAPGTTMDLWSINPTTGFFDNVGTGKVTADGTAIETISGGIRNSSWHFFAPPAPAPKNPGQDPRNPKDKCNECKAKGGLTSEVEMHSGAVIETHDLVPYQSMGESRSFTLTYDSLRADPRHIVHFGYNNAPADPAQKLVAKLTVDAGKFKYQIPGYSGNQYGLTGGEHFWSMPQNGGNIDAALQVDMSALPSGQYDYTINSGIRRFTGTIFAGSSTDTRDKFVSVNSINSPFGSGWGIAGWQELVENADASVLLIDGDGGELVFDKSTAAAGGYVSPPGDFSKLEKLADGTFTRTLTDKTVYSFNTSKRLVSVKEANGDETKYIYEPSGQLSQIIDPAGLITKLTYANGKVSQIEDPAGRLTKLEYDGAGNLQKIVDPDNKARTFSYDAQRHITKEIDKRGFSEQTLYDFAGRATGGIRKDGSPLQVAPVQVQGLYRKEDTTNPLNAPVAKPLGAVEASYSDGSGGVVTQILDQTGQVVSAKDGGGNKPTFERNQNLLVTKRTDGRGNNTTYEYDAKGNVKSISDSLSGSGQTNSNNNNTNTDLLLNGNNYAVGDYPVSVAVGDVNGDRIPDIVTANLNSRNISLLRGKEDKTYEPKIDISLGSANGQPRDVALADTDRDGDLDILVAGALPTTFSGGISSSNILILSNNGGNFTANTNNPMVGASPFALATGDMNGDGRSDIVTLNSDNNRRISVLLADSSSSSGFTTTHYQLNSSAEKLVLADVNRDGRLDVVAASSLNIFVMLGSGNGSLGSPITSAMTINFALRSLAVADLNADGNPEAIVAQSRGWGEQSLTVLSGSGNGSFNSPTNYPFNSNSFTSLAFDFISVAAGDLELDNDVDLVISGSGYYGSDDRAIVWLNNGIGGFTEVDTVNLGTPSQRIFNGPAAPVLSDLDGDGDLDLVVANQNSDNVAPRFNNSELTGGGAGKRSYTYDPVFNQVTSETDELGRQTLYEVDPVTGNRRKMTQVVGAVGGTDDAVTNYTYTNKNLIDTETDPNGRVTDYDYDPVTNRLVKITFAKGTVDEAVQQFEYDAAGNQTAVIDENGNRTEYEYNAMNQLKKTTFAKGTSEEATQQFEYDGAGNQTAVIDENGNRTEYQYDVMNHLIKEIAPDPDGSGPLTSPVTSYEYDKNGNQVLMVDPLGRRTQYRYDSRNRLVETVNPDGTVEKMRYDADNNQTANFDAKGNRTNKVYDARGRLIREVDAADKVTRFEYDAANQLKAQVDANNSRTEYKYDDLGRRTDVTVGATSAIASTSKTEYDKVGNVTAEIDGNNNKTQYVYDARNRQTRVIDALTPSGTTITEYDKVGNVLSVTDPLLRKTSFTYDPLNRQKTVTDPRLNTTTYTYDKAGNRTKITDALNRTTEYTFDNLNRQIGTKNPLSHTTKSTYDTNSNLLTFTNELGEQTTYTYDKKDRVTAVTDPIGNKVSTEYDLNGNVSAVTDGLGNTTRYGYDALNRQTTVTDALNKVTTTAYDNVGNISSITDPANNKTTYAYDELNRLKTETNVPLNRTRSYTYDTASNLITAKDGNNRTRKFVYDKLNRPTEEQWLNSANTPIRTITSSYDAAGQLKTISDPDATYTLTYDLAGNLETVDNAGTPNLPNVLLKYTYNKVNNPISVTDTINGQLRGTKSFTYDDANRVTRIAQSGNGVSSKRVDMSYDAANRVKDVTRYSDLDGTKLVAKSEYAYDRAGRLTRLSHGKDNVVLANYAWTYDFANRVTGFNSPLGNSSYSYDKRDQLTGADYTTQTDENYSYDDNGNRSSSGYQTGSNNQLRSDGVYNYEYDGEGNLRKRTDIVTGEITEYSWDYRNRLTSVVGKNNGGAVIKSANYTYDGLNRRIVKEVDADGAGSGVPQFDRMVYDGQQVVLSFDGGGNQTHRYLYGVQTDEILADESAGGSVLWPLTDNLGTVRDLVDVNGIIQNRIGYDSFGKVTAQTNPSVGFRFGFTGQELDAETGNYYYNSRYYDPKVGRFISEDTVGFAGGDANLYRYVGNSSTNYTDPSGEQVAIPLPAPPFPLPPLGGLLQRVPGLGGAAGILLAPPGGGGVLNPLPAGQDDRLFQERLRRGLIRPQGQNQPTPPLKTPPTRPSQTAPAPAPASAPKSASPTRTPEKKGSNCPTCDTPPFSSYDKCTDLVRSDLPFGGYKDTSAFSAAKAIQNFRGKHPQIKDYRELQPQRGQGDPATKFKCKNPTDANHYNVFIKDLLPSEVSAGSIAECKCCKEGNPPELVNRFAILNIKDKQGNKYINRGY